MAEIHGHEVMAMIMDADKAYTKETLEADIVDRFGADARFFTCSAENLDAMAEDVAAQGSLGFNMEMLAQTQVDACVLTLIYQAGISVADATRVVRAIPDGPWTQAQKHTRL